jgi:hypothetical protein
MFRNNGLAALIPRPLLPQEKGRKVKAWSFFSLSHLKEALSYEATVYTHLWFCC